MKNNSIKEKKCKHKFIKMGFISGGDRYIPKGYIFCEKCGEKKELKFYE